MERIVRSLRIMGLSGISVFYPDPEQADLVLVGFSCTEVSAIAEHEGLHWNDLVEFPLDLLPRIAPVTHAAFAEGWAPLGGGVMETLIVMGPAEAEARIYAAKIRNGFAIVLLHVTEAGEERWSTSYDAFDATDIA